MLKALLILFIATASATGDANATEPAEWNWHDAVWIACTRPMAQAQLAPAELMGPWIEATGNGAIRGYVGNLTLPEIPVVRAMAYWDSQTKAKTALVINGEDAWFENQLNRSRRYSDIAFDLKPGTNQVEIRFGGATKPVPVCFGLRVDLADGSVREFRSSESWQALQAKSKPSPVKVLAEYGAEGFRKVVAFPRQRLAPVWFRRGFEVKPGLKKATLLHTGVGYADAWLNGRRVADRVLSPPQTDYEAFTMFEADEVTGLLQDGANALSIQLAPGWYHQVGGFSAVSSYGRPRMRACLILEYVDGHRETVVSGPDWEWKEGAWREANVYTGEVVDFRRDHREWTGPGKGKGWQAAVSIDAPGKDMMLRDFEPMRRIREIPPRSITEVGKQTWLLDFGENIAGWIHLPIHENAGEQIFIRYSEMAADGRIWNTPLSHWWCHGEPQRDLVIAGDAPVTYESRFTYKGFRWVEISGLSQAPDPENVRAVVVNTDVKPRARFTSSDPLLNRLWEMGLRTHYANMHSILEDCPHREKCMWGGDAHGSWSMGFHALDSAAFYRQQVRLFYTGPMAPGGIPGRIGVGKRLTTAQHDFNWGVSPLFLTWRLWTHFGDLETAREFHPSMRNYLAHFDREDSNGFPYLHGYGDHAAPTDDVPRKPDDKALISAFHYFAAAERVAQLSERLGKHEDAKWAENLAKRIRKGILTRYDGEAHTFGNGTQDSLALGMGVFSGDAPEEQALAASLVGHYRSNGYQYDGGFMSYWIYPMLSRFGYTDEAFRMLTNPDYPGPAWSVKRYDATSFWEKFFSDPALQFERSLSHHATNFPAAWLLTDLAGIRIDMEQPGGTHLLLAPNFPEALDKVEAAMKTVAGGEVASAWKREGDRIEWSVTVPAGVSARTHLPGWQQADGSDLPTELKAGHHEMVLSKR